MIVHNIFNYPNKTFFSIMFDTTLKKINIFYLNIKHFFKIHF